MSRAYLATVAVIGLLLVIEHLLVHPDDMRRVNVAFFHVNSLVSLTVLAGVLLDETVRRGGWMG